MPGESSNGTANNATNSSASGTTPAASVSAPGQSTPQTGSVPVKSDKWEAGAIAAINARNAAEANGVTAVADAGDETNDVDAASAADQSGDSWDGSDAIDSTDDFESDASDETPAEPAKPQAAAKSKVDELLSQVDLIQAVAQLNKSGMSKASIDKILASSPEALVELAKAQAGGDDKSKGSEKAKEKPAPSDDFDDVIAEALKPLADSFDEDTFNAMAGPFKAVTQHAMAQVEKVRQQYGNLESVLEDLHVGILARDMQGTHKQLGTKDGIKAAKAKMHELSAGGGYTDMETLLSDAAKALWPVTKQSVQLDMARNHAARSNGQPLPPSNPPSNPSSPRTMTRDAFDANIYKMLEAQKPDTEIAAFRKQWEPRLVDSKKKLVGAA